jgi:transketolase N-terminal domain/subunit
VVDAVDRIDQKETEIRKTMDAILKYHKMQTVEEMTDKLQGLMSREEWEAYKEQVSELRGHNKTLDTILDASSVVAFLSGTSVALGMFLALPLSKCLDLGLYS